MPRTASLASQVRQASLGLLSSVTDMVLAVCFCLAEFSSTPRSQWYDIDRRVQDHLNRFNATSLKRAFTHLTQQHLITPPSPSSSLPHITTAGAQKIRSTIPRYRRHRPWHGQFYLVSYDLPDTRTLDRNRLRKLLQTLGFGQLQKSVWLSPYHPQTLLPKLIDTQNLTQLIAVSRLDSTLGLGSQNPQQLIPRLYPIARLNSQYQDFIHKFTTGTINPLTTAFAYWHILRQDPQLPFELLPPKWQGDSAYHLFQKLTGFT